MSNFNYLDFFKIPSETDTKLFLKDKNNNIIWTISNFMIASYFVQNNNIRINLTNTDHVIIDFNNVYESKIAITKLKDVIATLNNRVPFEIEKDVQLYVNSKILSGPTGSVGPQGNIGGIGPQGNIGGTGPQGNIGGTGPQGNIGGTGPQGNIGDIGPQGMNGDLYYGTSSTTLAIPDVGYVVNIQFPNNLAYSIGQNVIIANTMESYYADPDYDDDDYQSGFFEGQVEWYDTITGTMSIVTSYSQGVGMTYSFWYINLSGLSGIDGATGPQGNVAPVAGITGNIQYSDGSGGLSSSNFFNWDGTYLQIGTPSGISLQSDSSIYLNGTTDTKWKITRVSNYELGGLTNTAMQFLIAPTGEGVSIDNSNGSSMFQVSGNAEYAYVAAPLTIGNYTLPNIDGSSGQTIMTDGAGTVSWQTVVGTPGATGIRGSQWFQGSSNPLGTIPGIIDNDYYLQTTNNSVWIYSGGTWYDIANITGAQGAAGSTAEVIQYQRVVPTDGGSYSIPDGGYSLYMNLNANGTLMTYSVYMPPNPNDGQVIHIIASNNNIFNWNINNLFIFPSGIQQMDNAVATCSIWPNRSSAYMWVSIDTTWVRIS